MKLATTLIGLIASPAYCSSAKKLSIYTEAEHAALEAECGDLGVMEWKLDDLTDKDNTTTLRKCKEHPTSFNVSSPLENITANAMDLESSPNESSHRPHGCRGKGGDYDYGCVKGWCWRNCDIVFKGLWPWGDKPWCWLAYNKGKGDWTPCGGWADCEWSYNHENARCAKGNCDTCGCSDCLR